MSDQPNGQKKPGDPIRRCDVLIRWVWATIIGIWFGWGFFTPLVVMVQVAAVRIKVHESHPHEVEGCTYCTLANDAANSAVKSAGAWIVLPATLSLIVIWLQLRRLRKRLIQH